MFHVVFCCEEWFFPKAILYEYDIFVHKQKVVGHTNGCPITMVQERIDQHAAHLRNMLFDDESHSVPN